MKVRARVGVVLLVVCSCTGPTQQKRLQADGGTIQADSALQPDGMLQADTGPPIVPGQLNHMVLFGSVLDQSDAPIAGVEISFTYLKSTVPGTYFSQTIVTSDASGHYQATFDAVPDAIDGGLAFVDLWPSNTYELDHRYLRVLTQTPTVDFHLRTIEMINVGDSVRVTVGPDDSICSNNVQDQHPWDPESNCHTLRVIARSDGTLVINMTPADGGTAQSGLEVETLAGAWNYDFSPSTSHTTSIPTAAGDTVLVSPELIWTAPSAQSFTITVEVL